MSSATEQLCGELRQRVQQLVGLRQGSCPADLVGEALLESRIDVRSLTLDQWKTLLFAALQTARAGGCKASVAA